MQRFFYALSLFSLIFVIGCGGSVVVKGTVKMADGTPVETGTVVFLGEKEQFSADIQPGGKFSPGKFKDGDGITPGVYKIGVRGVVRKEERSESSYLTPPKSLIHSKYADALTSGLTIDTTKTKTLDLVLDPTE